MMASRQDVGTDKRFTGHQQGGDLYFMQSRFLRLRSGQAYDPDIGRFLQPDTIVPDPMDPSASGGLNRYSGACPRAQRRVLNNPLRYTDPTGGSTYHHE